MDWNNDGRIDGFDYAFYHNVISEEGGGSSGDGDSSGGGSYSARKNTSSTNKTDSNNDSNSGNTDIDAYGCATLAVIGLIIYMFIKLVAG